MGNCQGLLCWKPKPTVGELVNKADLNDSEKNRVKTVLAADPFNIATASPYTNQLRNISRAQLQAQGLNAKEANALVAAVPDRNLAPTLAEMVEAADVIAVDRKAVVKAALASIGYSEELRNGPALRNLTEEQLRAVRILGPLDLTLTQRELKAILDFTWEEGTWSPKDKGRRQIVAGQSKGEGKSEDSRDIEKLRRDYQKQVDNVDDPREVAWAGDEAAKDVIRFMYRLAFDARRRDKLHSKASLYYGAWKSVVQWLLVLASFGATIVAAVNTANSSTIAKVITLIFTGVTAFTSGWNAIVSPATTAEKHRGAAAKYYKLASDIRESILDAKGKRNLAGTPHRSPPAEELMQSLIKFRSNFNVIGTASPDYPFWAVGERKVQFRHGNLGLWAMNGLYWCCGPFCGPVTAEEGGQAPSFGIKSPPGP